MVVKTVLSCIERRTMMRTRMEEEEEYLGCGWVL
jgi:hypothetical protein